MRIWLLAIALIGFCFISAVLPSQLAYASSARQRPLVAIFPVVDNSSQKAGRLAAAEINEKLAEKFGTGKYIILSGQALSDSLHKEGIDDIRSTDIAVLQAALQRLSVDYSVRSELQYVTLKQKVAFPSVLMFIKTWTATVPVYINIADVNQGYAVYECTIVESGRHEAVIGFANQADAVRNAMGKVLDRIDREVPLPD